MKRLRHWLFDNRFHKKVSKLQHEQVAEHREILGDVRSRNRGILHDLADEVLKLDAVSDSLESTLREMREDG